MIEIKDLLFKRDLPFTLRIPHLKIQRGSFVFIMGLNGSGKTTLLHILSKVLPFQQGEIYLDQKPLSRTSFQECAQSVALVEQTQEDTFPYTVFEMVLMGRFARQGSRFFESVEDLQKAEAAMRAARIEHYRNRSITHLSGGERRRVEIARALCQETDVLLLDEPTAFLDVRQEESLLNLLGELHRQNGTTILFTTHRFDLLQPLGDRLLVLKEGGLDEDVSLKNPGLSLEALRKRFLR